MNDASNDVLRRNRRRDAPARIDRFEPRALPAATEILKEPPGNAVHRGDHDGFGLEQRPDRLGDAAERGPFHRDHHDVLRSRGCGVLGHQRRHDGQLVCALQAPAMLEQRSRRRATSDRGHVGAVLGEPRADEAADCADPEDADFHSRSVLLLKHVMSFLANCDSRRSA